MNSRFQQPLWLFATVLSLLCCGACKDKKEKATIAPAVKVTVMEVSPATLDNPREFSGTVSSSETTTVSFSVAGTITSLYAKEGQKVSKGQLLGKVRDGDYLNAYNIAAAQLAEAQDGYDRLKKLHDANALPDVKWVEIQQKLTQARNAAEMAKRTLEDTDLHSPVAGTVTRKFADTGQTVVPAQPIYEIVAIGDLTIDISVSENQVGDFTVGDKATVKIEAAGDGEIQGKVTQKSVVADPLTRSFTVKVSIPDKGGKVLPGMLGNVYFPHPDSPDETKTASRKVSGFVLPTQAVLLNDDNRWFVWTVKDSVARRQFVEVGQLVNNGVSVVSGLSQGDKVIVEGVQKVGTGTRVKF